MKGYGTKTDKRAGKGSATQVLDNSDKKKSTLTVRISDNDRETIQSIADVLRKNGYQFSQGNAVRVAVRLLDITSEEGKTEVIKIAEELKNEDQRKR